MAIEGRDLQILSVVLADRMRQARDELTDLDRAIGDGDHGVTMDLGWQAVKDALLPLVDPSLNEALRVAGQTFLRTVGATVGPLYATGLLDMSTWTVNRKTLTAADSLPIFEVFVGGLTRRGHAVLGDKTMMDTWLPALDAFRAGFPRGINVAANKALAAAHQGVLATGQMTALKGRAGRLGERSVGHVDPGARSAYIILETTIIWLTNRTD